MENKPLQLLQHTKSKFSENAHPSQAFGMSKYMKFKFAYYGIKKPLRAALQKEIINEFGKPDIETIKKFAVLAWNEPEREVQYFAIELLTAHKKKLKLEDLELIKFLIQNKSWWDTVDNIAANLAGSYFKLFPNNKELNNWIKSDNFWVQRSAIIHQLSYKKETNEQVLFEFCRQLKDEKEFFIRKAIGWALRQYAKVAPLNVSNFFNNNELSPLSKREALKNLK